MSRSIWVVLGFLCCVVAFTRAAPPRPYSEIRAEAEAAFARGAFADARELYAEVDVAALRPGDARWVRFRLADCAWRSAASSENPDTTALDRAFQELQTLVRETVRPEDKDSTYAEIEESIGDFSWDRVRYGDWSQATAHYAAALDVWAGSPDLERARARYLSLVWRMAEPRWADEWFEYGHYSGNWITIDVLENALRIATTPDDRAHAHFLLGQTLASRGDPMQRVRALQHYEAALATGKESAWYDDALYRLACTICDSGVSELDDLGRWSTRMDYPRALELYRRFAREFRAGESRWHDDVENRIRTITSPTLYLSTSFQFAPGSKVRYDVSWRNVGNLDLALYPTDLTRDVVISEEMPSSSFVQSIDITKLEPVVTWTHDTNDDGKHVPGAATLYVPQALLPGAYVLEARGAGQTARDFVLVSDAALTTHSLGADTLAWFCDASNGKPIAAAKLVLWQREWTGNVWKATRFDATTGDDGTAKFTLPQGHHYGDFVVLAKHAERQSFALSNVSWPSLRSPPYRVFATTDRPAYRPGHLVQWKFTVRAYDGAVYGNPGRTKVRYRIHDPRGTEFKTDQVELNDFGSAFATIETTAAMALGEYRVTFEANDGSTIGSNALFRIEEYKLPEFEVAVKPATMDGKPLLFRVGDVLTADVVANYYFGGPVRDASVEILVKQRPYVHAFPRRGKYEWLYESDERSTWWRYGGEQIVQQTTTKTDANGVAHVSFQTPHGVDDEFEYEIEARVIDASRREVTGSGSVRVTQRAYAVEVHLPHRLTKPGDSIDVELLAQDANRSPVAAEGLVTVTRRTYREIWTRPDGATASTMRDASYVLTGGVYDDEPITAIAASTDAQGSGSIRFVAPREGFYRIVWSSRDDRGMLVRGEASAFVASPTTADVGYRGQELELIVDTDTFKSGAAAPFMITTRHSGRWVLFVAAADRMLEHRVIHVQGRAKLETLNVGPEHIPNAFLTVLGFSNAVAQHAQVEIIVPPERQFLDIAVSAEATDVEPGTATDVLVTVKDSNGEPVRTELSLAVTDAAVTSIQSAYSGDPRPFFYGDRRWMQLAIGASTFSRAFTDLKLGKDGVYDALGLQSALGASRDEGEHDAGGRKSEIAQELSDSRSDSLAKNMAPAPAAAARGFVGGRAFDEDLEVKEDAGGLTEGDSAVKVRTDFRETALWLPTLVTDAQGRATARVSWPDSLTRWSARAIGFDAISRCGEGTTTVRTRKPLMVRLQAPRFFVVGDEITLSAVLNNDTDIAMNVTPTLVLEGLELLGRWLDGALLLDGFEAVVVPAHGEARADWRVRATAPGTARFSVTAKSDRYADAMEMTYPVHAHGVEVFAATSGKMRGDAVTSILDLPALRQDGSTRFSVQVAPSLAVATLDALPYLIDYPYGCTEQTMSRFLPAVITAKTLRDQGLTAEDVASRVFGGVERATADKTHTKSAGLARLDDVTRASLARLADMQHGDGGFGWWKTGDSDRFMTAYVVQGLTLAHEAGIDVDLNVLTNAAAYLDRSLVEEERNPDMQAWMLYALATYGAKVQGARSAEFATTAFQNLWAQHRELNAYTRALFALAAHALGRADEARTLVDNLKNGVIRDEAPESSLVQRGNERVNAATMPTAHWGEDGVRWRWSEGGVEATAWAIRALLAVDPKHELVEPAVNWLLRNRRGNQWSNTRDTALCVLAMNDYLRVSGELGRSVGYSVSVNGKVVAERTVAPAEILAAPSVFPIDPGVLVAGKNEIEVRRTSGDGPLYFAAQATFFSTEARVKPRGNEIFVRRTYWKLVPRPTLLKGVVYDRVLMKEGDHVVSGERVEVVLTIEAKNHYDYLVFEDLKPAGLEAVTVRSGEPLYAQELKSGETEHRFGTDSADGEDGEDGADDEAAEATPGVRVPGSSDTFGTTGRTAWIHAELRDRKVALFFSHLPQGVWEVKYDLRAEVPGSFAALPVLGHAMYVPEIRCNGEEIGMTVDERR